MSDSRSDQFKPSADNPRLRVNDDREGKPIEPNLFGKFCEHLGRNVTKGMQAQILLNPTFGRWEFPANDDHPDGGIQPQHDPEKLRASIRQYCDRWDLPHADVLYKAYTNGCAFGWTTVGNAYPTPDTSPERDRAQRLVVEESGGLRQRIYLPLHRTQEYDLTCRLRATQETAVSFAITTGNGKSAEKQLETVTFELDREWTTKSAAMTLPETVVDSDDLFAMVLTVDESVDIVVDRVTLYPNDHVKKADPEVVDYLRDANLPLLRWPGGNFVSGYDWRDGIGPVNNRTTIVNPAWGDTEPNLFGTAEFIDFCESVDCEPMICVNAGDGTPREAAKWVEYCNGATNTEMGALRAEHGHPKPFDVRYWEIGNELFGGWQVNWTSPSGNADRYQQFREAMLAVDPDIDLVAVGNRNSPDNRWNNKLLDSAGGEVRSIADHILTGGRVHCGTDREELFYGFMGYADQLGREYRDLQERMLDAGIDNPRLALTELQLFADYERNRELESHGSAFGPEKMPDRMSVSEPLYDATIIFEAIRMAPFVEMLTHSAMVNHGGGLQKKRERTWPDPAHHGHAMLAPLMEATPLEVELACDTISTSHSFGDIEASDSIPTIDAIAARDDDNLHVALVHRQIGNGPVTLTLDVSNFVTDTETAVTTLTADDMGAENTYESPDAVAPEYTTASITNGTVDVDLPDCSLVRLTVSL